MWKEEVVTYFSVLAQRLSEDT